MHMKISDKSSASWRSSAFALPSLGREREANLRAPFIVRWLPSLSMFTALPTRIQLLYSLDCVTFFGCSKCPLFGLSSPSFFALCVRARAFTSVWPLSSFIFHRITYTLWSSLPPLWPVPAQLIGLVDCSYLSEMDTLSSCWCEWTTFAATAELCRPGIAQLAPEQGVRWMAP